MARPRGLKIHWKLDNFSPFGVTGVKSVLCSYDVLICPSLHQCRGTHIVSGLQIFRQKNIFVLAANYLQTLDWHGDAKLMKIIVQVIAHF